MILKTNLLVSIVFVAGLATGCNTIQPVKPLYVASDYESHQINQITALPLFDARKDKSTEMDLKESYQEAVHRALVEQRKYKVVHTDEFGMELYEEDIINAKPDWIKKLGPDDARYVLLVMLEDLQSRMTFGSVASSEISGWLFDRQNGAVIWQHKGIGKSGQGGLIGMMMKGAMASAALNISISEMFRALPVKGELPVTTETRQAATRSEDDF